MSVNCLISSSLCFISSRVSPPSSFIVNKPQIECYCMQFFYIDFLISYVMKILWRSSYIRFVVRVLLTVAKNLCIYVEKIHEQFGSKMRQFFQRINLDHRLRCVNIIYVRYNFVLWKQATNAYQNHGRCPLCKSWILLFPGNHAWAISLFAIMGVIPILQSWTLSYVTPPPLRTSTNTPTTQ